MNTATKEAYKELAKSVWRVAKVAGMILLIAMAAGAADGGEYDRAAFCVALAVFLR